MAVALAEAGAAVVAVVVFRMVVGINNYTHRTQKATNDDSMDRQWVLNG